MSVHMSYLSLRLQQALHLAALANDTEASAVLCGTELSLDLEARNTVGGNWLTSSRLVSLC